MVVKHTCRLRDDFSSMCFQQLDGECEIVVHWPHPAGRGVDHMQRKNARIILLGNVDSRFQYRIDRACTNRNENPCEHSGCLFVVEQWSTAAYCVRDPRPYLHAEE